MLYAMTIFFLPVFSENDSFVDPEVMGSLAGYVGSILFSPLLVMSFFGWKETDAEKADYSVKTVGIMLNDGEWWGLLDADGDEHWYQEGSDSEYHIPAN